MKRKHKIDRKYKRNCDVCGKYYEGGGKYCCSRECSYINRKKKITCICRYCKIEFVKRPSDITKGSGIYCSQDCLHQHKKHHNINTCIHCKSEFITTNSRIDKKYCSLKCFHEYKQVNLVCKFCNSKFIVPRFKKNKLFCSEECKKKWSFSNYKSTIHCIMCNKPIVAYNSYIKNKGQKTCSKICENKYRSVYLSGENSKLYKHGKSYNNRIRKGIEWKTWRRFIFDRDDYTCMICGIKNKKGLNIELHPHHIKPSSKYPLLRYEVDNGITVCKSCHYKIHAPKQQTLGQLSLIDSYKEIYNNG